VAEFVAPCELDADREDVPQAPAKHVAATVMQPSIITASNTTKIQTRLLILDAPGRYRKKESPLTDPTVLSGAGLEAISSPRRIASSTEVSISRSSNPTGATGKSNPIADQSSSGKLADCSLQSLGSIKILKPN